MARGAGAHPADLRRTFGRKRVEIPTGVKVVALGGRELRHRGGRVRVPGEGQDHTLPVTRNRDECCTRRSPQRLLVGSEVTDDGRWALHPEPKISGPVRENAA